MDKHSLANIGSDLILGVIEMEKKSGVSAQAESYEGEFYVSLANMMRIGDYNVEPDKLALMALSELPKYMCGVLACLMRHQHRMPHEIMQRMSHSLVLDKLEILERRILRKLRNQGKAQ